MKNRDDYLSQIILDIFNTDTDNETSVDEPDLISLCSEDDIDVLDMVENNKITIKNQNKN